MGARQTALETVLMEAGVATAGRKIGLPLATDIHESGLGEIVDRVYRELGGRRERPRIAPGPWDITANETAIELDEERHFNRYRLVTLNSPVYLKLSGLDVALYREYCRRYEAQCLQSAGHGGYWSNKSCEREFGPPSPNGNLSGRGAPRWKQRAFYDFIKDLAPIALGVRVARVSVWDTIKVRETYRVWEALDRLARTPTEASIWASPLMTLIDERTSA